MGLELPFDDENDGETEIVDVQNDAKGDDGDDDFFAPSLCRQKSFEGLMGGFLKKAAPKKVVRKQEPEPEDTMNNEPERGTLGRSKSMEENDLRQYAAATQGGEEPHRPRGGRRPLRSEASTICPAK